ncbi:sugar ABC transporter substrate-binding protein [Chloroflexi bacterium TSY]|nr:sugar ABC transporter substrate-binding protein [Chloroflexi bacterium TSY]
MLKNDKRRLMLVAGFASILILLIAACAPVGAPGAESSGAIAGGDEVVTIKWFMRWDQTRVDNVAMPVIEAFEEQHPNIKVEFENIGRSSEYYQKLQTTIAAGLAPDVFYPATHIAYALASKGGLLPIDDYITADGLDMAKYDQSILELYQQEGQQYCLPIDTAALVVFYNKEMFDAAGVAYPEAGWIWDDFLATALALTVDSDDDGQTDQFGVDVFTNYWPMVVWTQTGHALYDDIRNPTEFLGADEDSVAAVQWLADLINVHGVMPSAEQRADIGDMFVAGKAAMQVVGHWRVPRYLANAEFAFDFAPLPVGKIAANRADGSCFAVSASSEHPDEAWEFVKFLAGPDSLGVSLLLDLQQMTPVVLEFQDSEAFLNPEGLEGSNKEAFLAGKDNLFSMYDPIHPMYAEWDALWKQELGEVWLGNATAAEAFERMIPEVEELLANLADYE